MKVSGFINLNFKKGNRLPLTDADSCAQNSIR